MGGGSGGRKMVEVNRVYQGDVIEVLKIFPDEFVDCVVTSPQ